MQKRLLLLLATLGAPAYMCAQSGKETPRKWDLGIEQLFRQQQTIANSRSLKSTTDTTAVDTIVGVIIKTSNSEKLVAELRTSGYEARIITPEIITARLPLSAVPTVAQNPLTKFVNASRKHRPHMDKAREATNADKVQEGTGLDTPYTGKGVIVAVIDQGFQFNHPAFKDKDENSRIIAMWNRYAKRPTPTFGTISDTHDNITNAGGHGTHVTGIAAGSDRGNGYKGMAPEADIIMIPSSFDDGEILEDLAFIDSIATAQNKPAVVNMSFGSTVGPHDGSRDYDQAANRFITSKPGRIITASMGNDAESRLHARHRFTNNNEVVYLLIKRNSSNQVFLDLWGMATDSMTHLTVTPYFSNASGQNRTAVKYRASSRRSWYEEIDENNKRERYIFYGTLTGHVSTLTDPYLLVEIRGHAGDEFHAWINEGYGEFINTVSGLSNLVASDADYCVGEGAASIPNAVAVSSYTTRLDWNALNGRHYSYTHESVGQISSFSSRGPWLGSVNKPTITAPGSFIASAFNRFDSDFSAQSPFVVSQVQTAGTTDYYGLMQGTSMSTPATAGIVALWLQANPSLTSDDVIDIMKTTAVKDRFTSYTDWTKFRGYGKIDAYEGLKAALRKVTSIQAVHRSEAPVTIQRENDGWRLLFGSVEQNVAVQVFSIGGQLMQSQQLGNVSPGTEATVSFSTLPSGVYVVRITTPNATISRKVVR